MTPSKLWKTAFVLTAAGFVFHAGAAPGDTWRNAQGEEVRQHHPQGLGRKSLRMKQEARPMALGQ